MDSCKFMANAKQQQKCYETNAKNIDAPREIIKGGIMAFSWMGNGEISAQEKPFEIFYWKKLAILSAKLSDVKYEEFLQFIKKK